MLKDQAYKMLDSLVDSDEYDAPMVVFAPNLLYGLFPLTKTEAWDMYKDWEAGRNKQIA